MFINVACVLHVFDITPPLGQDGRPIRIEHVLSDTLVSCVPCHSRSDGGESLTRLLQPPRGLSVHY